MVWMSTSSTTCQLHGTRAAATSLQVGPEGACHAVRCVTLCAGCFHRDAACTCPFKLQQCWQSLPNCNMSGHDDLTCCLRQVSNWRANIRCPYPPADQTHGHDDCRLRAVLQVQPMQPYMCTTWVLPRSWQGCEATQ
jgi:hypothetical protein